MGWCSLFDFDWFWGLRVVVFAIPFVFYCLEVVGCSVNSVGISIL